MWVDPYSVTNAMHGLLVLRALWLTLGAWPGARRAPPRARHRGDVEIAENTNAMIERYRRRRSRSIYYGDSVINSVGDIASFALGYMRRRRSRPGSPSRASSPARHS
jgi:hypothetical protein